MTIRFVPAPDYDNLKKQANALYLLANSFQNQNSLYHKQLNELKLELAMKSDAAISAEYATNETLTNELERLQGRLDENMFQMQKGNEV